MRISLLVILVLLFATTQAFLPSTLDQGKCLKAVQLINDRYQSSNPHQRSVFEKFAFAELKKVHPKKSETTLNLFISGVLFSKEPSTNAQICRFYFTMLGPHKFTKSNDIFQCLFGFLADKYTLPEILRILGVCFEKDDSHTCVANEVGMSLMPNIRTCFGKKKEITNSELPAQSQDDECPKKVRAARKHYNGLDVEGKLRFSKKLFNKLTEKYSHVCPRKISAFMILLLKSRMSDEGVCTVYNNQFVQRGYKSPNQKDEPTCADKVDKARKYFRNLSKKEKKAFVKRLFKGLVKQYPDASKRSVAVFIAAFLWKRVPGKKVCKLYKKLFLGDKKVKEDKPKCAEKVEKVRKYFKELDNEGKKEFVKKLAKKLSEKYPDVPKKNVVRFIAVLLSEKVKPKNVCRLYKRIFLGVKPKCGKKVKKVRKYFKKLDKEGKKKFVKKLAKKLTEKYPDVPKKRVFAFIAALLFKRVKPKKVCRLYKIIFLGAKCAKKVGKVRKYFQTLDKEEKKKFVKKLFKKLSEKYPDVSKRTVFGFVVGLLSERVKPRKVCRLYKRIFLGVKPKCGKKVKKARKYFKKLDKEGKKKFVKKLAKKLSKKYPDVPKKRVVVFIAALLFKFVKPKKVCRLYKRIFLGGRSKCGKKVIKARKYFKKLDKEGKKEFVKKLAKKLTEKYPDVPKKRVLVFIAALLFKRVPPKNVCKLYKKIFLSESETSHKRTDKPDCPEKVEKARAYFKDLDNQEKKEFVVKLYKGLTKQYPDVDRKKVVFFIGALLFNRVEPKKVCALYSKIFLSNDDEKVELKDGPTCADKVDEARKYFKNLSKKEKKAFVKRLFKGLVEQYPDASKRRVALFIAAFLWRRVPGKKVCKLYKKLFHGDKKVKEDKPTCAERVEKARNEFDGLSFSEKTEFIVKLYKELTTRYPDVERVKITGFIGALLISRVPAEAVCKLYDAIRSNETKKVNMKKDDKPTKEDKPTCPEKVEKARKHFDDLSLTEKREFVLKLYKGLTTKYPDVERVKVAGFIGTLLVKRVPPKAVCELYVLLFKSKVEKLRSK